MLPLVLDSIPVGVMIVDARGDCLYLNHEFTSITGYTFEDVAADQRYCREICSGAIEVLSAGARPWGGWGRAVVDRQPTIRCKTGETRQVRLRAASLTNDAVIVTIEHRARPSQTIGGLDRAVEEKGAQREEEFKKESGNEFRKLAERSLSLTGIFLIQDGLFRYVNSRFAETFGYAAEELVDRRGPRDLVPVEEWRQLEDRILGEEAAPRLTRCTRNFRADQGRRRHLRGAVRLARDREWKTGA